VPDFGEKLAFGFEPIGICVAGEIESTSALGNKIGPHRDLLVRQIERA
jgi:hypothetical protein